MFTLYVAKDKQVSTRYDSGSVLCVHLTETLANDATVQVQEVDATRRPLWVTGTPTLVDDSDGRVFRGTEAITMLHRVAVTCAEARGRRQGSDVASGGVGKKGKRHVSALMMAPEVQLRPEGHSSRDESVEEDGPLLHPDPGAPGTPGAPMQGVGSDDLWESQIGDGDGDEDADEDSETRKLKSDDLARALQSRQATDASVGAQLPLRR